MFSNIFFYFPEEPFLLTLLWSFGHRCVGKTNAFLHVFFGLLTPSTVFLKMSLHRGELSALRMDLFYYTLYLTFFLLFRKIIIVFRTAVCMYGRRRSDVLIFILLVPLGLHNGEFTFLKVCKAALEKRWALLWHKETLQGTSPKWKLGIAFCPCKT